jgi:hypothetical protein
MERLLKFFITAKETNAVHDSKMLAVYSALGDLTSDTMRTYPEWFKAKEDA